VELDEVATRSNGSGRVWGVLEGPFRGTEAIQRGLVTKRQLRGPRFRRLFPDVYVQATLGLDLAVRSRAAYLFVRDRGRVLAESPPETRLRVALVRAGLQPVVQHVVTDEHGFALARADLAYPDARLAVEYDGADHFDKMRAERDRFRTPSSRPTAGKPYGSPRKTWGCELAVAGVDAPPKHSIKTKCPGATLPDMAADSGRPRSFGDAAEEYDRVRLVPPAEAITWLLASDERLVLDLAAGTGHLTRFLERIGLDVVAVEPDEQMRAVLHGWSPRARVLDGVAERIPLSDASVDAVVVGSAWHWFKPGEALAEVARVVRDGGRLGVVGTSPDPFVDWMGELFDTEAEPYKENVRRIYVDVELPAGAPFDPVATASFGSLVPMAPEDALGLFRTASHYLVADAAERARLDARRGAVLAEHLDDAGLINLPIRSWAWRTERLDRTKPNSELT
jgi:SAM-dependent methyltransferase